MKEYGKVGYFRLLNIKVVSDDNEIIYEGQVDNAPAEIRDLSYTKWVLGEPLVLYVCSKMK